MKDPNQQPTDNTIQTAAKVSGTPISNTIDQATGNTPGPSRIDKWIPVKAVGPGSQPEDTGDLKSDFGDLPDEMMTYRAPVTPEPEDAVAFSAALQRAAEIQVALEKYRIGDDVSSFSLEDLDPANRAFISQMLGEGEVSVQCTSLPTYYEAGQTAIDPHAATSARVQESVLAGLWQVQYRGEDQQLTADTVEVADIPSLVSRQTFASAATELDLENLVCPEGVYNATPLLVEISDQIKQPPTADDEPYIINLSLLPHTEADLAFLSDQLGIGPTIILSRGYGNCRISSTATRNVWWVQYFNSQDTLILNTIEISTVPKVACAAAEDLSDSAYRLKEILDVYKPNQANPAMSTDSPANNFLPGSFGGDSSKLDRQSRLECKICWYIYDPAKGDDYWQIQPHTPFSELPDHWTCPECDGRKVDFMLLADEPAQ